MRLHVKLIDFFVEQTDMQRRAVYVAPAWLPDGFRSPWLLS